MISINYLKIYLYIGIITYVITLTNSLGRVGHWNHTAKQISLHLYLFFAAILYGIFGITLPMSIFTQSFQYSRILPSDLLPVRFSSIVVLSLLTCYLPPILSSHVHVSHLYNFFLQYLVFETILRVYSYVVYIILPSGCQYREP